MTNAAGDGGPRPTMRDVALRAGVSLKTVSRVVNGEPAVAAATAERVNAVIEALGFHRNELARSLRSRGGSRMIGVVIEDLSNPFYSGIAKGVEEEATARGYVVVIGSSEEDVRRERELMDALWVRRVEGVVLVPASRNHRYLAPEIEGGLQLVFVDRPPVGLRADTVLLDNRGAAHAATRMLIDEGHTRIGIVGDPVKLYAVGERVRGYREALSASGLAPDPQLERIGVHTAEECEAASADLLTRQKPTAVFCTNNRATIGLVRAMVRARAEIAVVGFDDFELADMLPVPLRVLRYDPVALGRLAAQAMFARISGNGGAPSRTVLKPEMVWRGLRG